MGGLSCVFLCTLCVSINFVAATAKFCAFGDKRTREMMTCKIFFLLLRNSFFFTKLNIIIIIIMGYNDTIMMIVLSFSSFLSHFQIIIIICEFGMGTHNFIFTFLYLSPNSSKNLFFLSFLIIVHFF